MNIFVWQNICLKGSFWLLTPVSLLLTACHSTKADSSSSVTPAAIKPQTELKILYGSKQGELTLYNMATNQIVRRFHFQPAEAIYNPRDNFLYYRNRSEIRKVNLLGEDSSFLSPSINYSSILSWSLSPDGKKLAIYGTKKQSNTSLSIFDIKSDVEVAEISDKELAQKVGYDFTDEDTWWGIAFAKTAGRILIALPSNEVRYEATGKRRPLTFEVDISKRKLRRVEYGYPVRGYTPEGTIVLEEFEIYEPKRGDRISLRFIKNGDIEKRYYLGNISIYFDGAVYLVVSKKEGRIIAEVFDSSHQKIAESVLPNCGHMRDVIALLR